MKKLFMLFAAVMVCLTAGAKSPQVEDVSVVGESAGNGGRPIVLVTCAAKKAGDVTDADLCRCAIRCMLFKGWTDESKSAGFDSSVNHPAIAGNPDVETQHADYFADFFASGQASNYASVIPDTRKVMKTGKMFYVSQMVTVNVPDLRKKLEKDNIIKSLRSGW